MPGRWLKLEVPLEAVGAGGKQIDGVAMLHQGGRVLWGHTELVGPGDQRLLLWGDSITLQPEQLAQVQIHVDGLKPGTPVEALFEDRQLTAADGHFTDDFRGRDLYQRFGGGFGGGGYGGAPVALHVYELPTK